MKTVLFVCYGSGHVNMILPVAQAVVAAGLAKVKVLGLTTAAPLVRAAQLDLLQIKDFVRPSNIADDSALVVGKRLMTDMPAVADPQETAAYLGLSFAELEEDVGHEEAAARYARDGRQAFLPRRLLQRVLREVQPDLVVATNSPRAERAAIDAACALALPCICMVDLFCIDEVKWIGSADYADKVCVLNDSVKQFLLSAGRTDEQIVVTGNPALDSLTDPVYVAAGSKLRSERQWASKRVLLWPTQVEPALHPFNGKPGDTTLPERAFKCVMEWVLRRDDCVLCVRARAGSVPMTLPADPRIVLTGQDVDLSVLLQAVDLVVTLNSTVGLQGHFAGARVLQILGSVFDNAMPLKRYGIADEAVVLAGVFDALDRCFTLPRNLPSGSQKNATASVLEVIDEFL